MPFINARAKDLGSTPWHLLYYIYIHPTVWAQNIIPSFFFFYIPHPIYHRVYLIRPSIYRLNFVTSYLFHCKNPYPKHHFPSPGQSSFIGFSYVASYFSTLQFLHNRVISGKLKACIIFQNLPLVSHSRQHKINTLNYGLL